MPFQVSLLQNAWETAQLNRTTSGGPTHSAPQADSRTARRSPPQFPPADRAAALQLIREDIGDCTRCALHKGRNKLVFADGDRPTRG